MTHNMFELSDEFQLGIEEVDKEHLKLVDVLNQTYILLGDGKREEARTFFNDGLSEYVNEHFEHEEAMLRRIGYPKLEEHKRVHENFRRSFASLKPKIEDGDDGAFRQALADAFAWLIGHIGKTDKRYAAHYFGDNES